MINTLKRHMNYAKFVNKTIQKTFGLFKLKLTRIASHGFPVDTEKEIIKFGNSLLNKGLNISEVSRLISKDLSILK